MEPQLSRPADYRVLARAYRPTKLSALIGQEALVRTLKNAFASGRVAHAFLLSGIRGVGKTTTARIIARGLNCTGPDGQGGPTPEPCGVCPSCRSIDEDRALDVIEMDAASQTGKDDVLELLEGLQFLPGSSRYKVYILDEVHMLSPKAWNALLKTVEEPPAHAKFVFATTEVRKVPITVLSRCQKFELRRVEPEELAAHLAGICEREAVAVGAEALALIARAADGSVRDALSLLDQAIATAEGPVEAQLVQSMLGLGDRLQLLELFDTVMRGDAAGALERFAALYGQGADPVAVAQDLLEISHWLSRLKVLPQATSGLGISGAARTTLTMGAAHAYYADSTIVAEAWGALSTDAARGATLEAERCKIVVRRSGYGTYADNGASVSIKDSSIDVPSFGGIIAGQASLSLQNVRLRPRGNAVMVHSVMGQPGELATLRIAGGDLHSTNAAIVVKSANAEITLDGVRLASDNGDLLLGVVNDDSFATKVNSQPVAGIRATIRRSRLAGNLIHLDTERRMAVSLEATQLQGAVHDVTLSLDPTSRWTATADSRVVLAEPTRLDQVDAPAGVRIEAHVAPGLAEPGEHRLRGGGVLDIR